MQENQNKMKILLNKVPQVTIFFWIIKILCTTVGETFADFINFNIGLGLTLTTIIMGVAFFIALFFQFKANKYVPTIYWVTVVLISVFGTLVTDNLTDNMGVPLEVSTVVFSVLLGLTFLFWYLSEKTLSIHSIFTRKREVFYWLTILFTFALGTAVGDLYSEQLGFGYLNTGIGVVIIIALVFLAYKFLKLDGVLAFLDCVYFNSSAWSVTWRLPISTKSKWRIRTRDNRYECDFSYRYFSDHRFPCRFKN